jgi:hypothetical protein
MTSLARLALAGLTALSAAALPFGAAQAADMIAVYPTDNGICGYPSVLGTISNRFDYQVHHVPHLPQVGIANFYNLHETRYLPETDENPIARRYCAGTVQLTDGSQRPVWYLIEYGMGFASIGDNVEFCVGGFDRWHVYDGYCRVLQ